MTELLDVLGNAQARGFIGPGSLEAQVHHALGFVSLVPAGATFGVDLGTGGGLPGLVLAARLPAVAWVFVDADAERVAFLDDAAARLGLANVQGSHARGEDYARAHRGEVDLVTARSFGAPAVVAECAAPLLVVGGTLLVSDPPAGPGERWPKAGVAQLGLEVVAHPEVGAAHFTVLRQAQACPDRFPRRVGVPARRPLF